MQLPFFDNKENVKLEIRFNWDAYPRQRSVGLIGGLLTESTSIDCDACAVFCDKEGKALSKQKKETCLSYDNDTMFDGAARHMGDNQTGKGLDDEIIYLDLNALPAEVGMIFLTLDVFKERNRSTIGKVQNTFIRIFKVGNSDLYAHFDFYNLSSNKKMVICGVLSRETRGWVFLPSEGHGPDVNSMDEFIGTL